jgi:hypothetical protein
MEKKRAGFEVVIVTVVVILTLALGLLLFKQRDKVQKGRVLIQELAAMRSGVSLFQMINNRLPSDLKELIGSTYEANSVTHPYIEFSGDKDEGKPLDQFGNPFVYDARTGWVRSSSRGYENW